MRPRVPVVLRCPSLQVLSGLQRIDWLLGRVYVSRQSPLARQSVNRAEKTLKAFEASL
jgi:hypothetical protein